MIRLTILIAAAILLAACSSYQPGDNGGSSRREAENRSQKAVVDMSGFSGYGWGTSIEFITTSMKNEEYDLISSGTKDVWYRGNIVDEKVQLVYLFQNGLLTGGMWVFDDVDPKSYWKVNEFLRNEYNSKAKLKVRGDDWIESEMEPLGTDARIIHRLDVEADRHVVHYYFADNLAAEEAARN